MNPDRLAFASPSACKRTEGAHLQRVDGVFEIVGRRSRGGEMEDPVQAALDVEIVRDVIVLEPEAFVGEWAGEILRVAGQQRVEAHDLPALGKESFAQMGAEQARPAGHERAWHVR